MATPDTYRVPLLFLTVGLALGLGQEKPHANLPSPFSPGFPAIRYPVDNPYLPERVILGKLLFFDGRLSSNGSVPCSFCHKPNHGFSDDSPLSFGVDGQPTGRHTPTLINRAWGKSEFWDGRAPTLESQVIIPITNPHEMGETTDQLVRKLQAIKGYPPLFAASFGDTTIDFDRITKALAAYERTIVSADSAYDRFVAGDKSALTKQQKAGLEFFNGKGECAECHKPPFFTDESFANLGVGATRPVPDPGRADVTKKKRDLGKFKVPTLRDLARRGPYMHDGSIKTLADVLDFYAKGGTPNPHVDTRLLQFYMDAGTKSDLLAFLDALNGNRPLDTQPPAKLPD